MVVPMVARRRAGVDMGHMSRRVSGQALGLVAAGFLFTATLGACTSGETPTSPPSAPSSTAVAPTTTAAPIASAVSDDEAAMGALTLYVKEFNDALQSRSTVALRLTHTEGCIPCSAESDKIDALKMTGRTIEGGKLTVDSLAIVQRINDGQLMIEGTLVQSAAMIRDASGRVVDSFDLAGPKKAFFLVRLVGGLWKVSGLSA